LPKYTFNISGVKLVARANINFGTSEIADSQRAREITLIGSVFAKCFTLHKGGQKQELEGGSILKEFVAFKEET